MNIQLTPPSARVLWSASLLALVIFGIAPPAASDELDIDARLVDARQKELQEKSFEEALAIYESLLEDRAALGDVRRGKVLKGAARCLRNLERYDDAIAIWDQILADRQLKASDHEWAQDEKKKLAQERARIKSEQDRGERFAQELAAIDKQRREEVRDFLLRAKKAFREGRYQDARQACYRAQGAAKPHESEYQDAQRLLQQIEQKLPNRGELIGNLLRFVQTLQIEEYQRLRENVRALFETGRRFYKEERFVEADDSFRQAILAIDDSSFRVTSDVMDADDLSRDRLDLLMWMRETHTEGRKLGLSFAPEPVPPDPSKKVGGHENRFYRFLADNFTASDDTSDPLRFYEMSPPRGERRFGGMQASKFDGGLSAGKDDSLLTRARWAERWIRRQIRGEWSTSGRPVRRPGSRRAEQAPRVRARFGHVICIQDSESVHRRIERELIAPFRAEPLEMVIDVHLMAGNLGTIVQATESLGVFAKFNESGHELVVRNKLVSECVEHLQQLPGDPLLHVGSVTLDMGTEHATVLHVTDLTKDHPVFQGLTPPPLTVPPDAARYGVWLDLYVEDMKPRRTMGQARAALSVVGSVREPVSSVNVPKQSGGLRHTRVPLLTEQRIEADRELEHASTFMLLGLRNPFPASNGEREQLIVLIGVRPRDVATPDTAPALPPSSRIIPDDSIRRDYDLRSFNEFIDQFVYEGWPVNLRAATIPPPLSVLREYRNDYLEDILARRAGIDLAPDILSVTDNTLTATLGKVEHAELQKQIDALMAHENDLFEIHVTSVIAAQDRLTDWTSLEGVEATENGSFLADERASVELRRRIGSAADDSLYATDIKLPVRATQQVVHQNLRVRQITKDIYIRSVDEKTKRYTPVYGVAEEGLLVEIRPGLTDENGFRPVRVRARAAKLAGIETKSYPGVPIKEAAIQLPRWHRVSDFSDGQQMKDGESLLLPIDMPGVSDGRKIVVMVTVRQVQ